MRRGFVPEHGATARRRLLVAGLAVPAAWLGGCAQTAPVARPPGERLIQGRFAATVVRDGQRDGGSGRFTLRLAGSAAQLDLSSSIGLTLARIEVDARGARLTASGQDGAPIEMRGRDAAELSQAALGFPLPVERIAAWIDGEPDLASPHAPLDIPAGPGAESGRAFRQDGWTVAVLERADDGRARRLLLERPAERDAAAITLRLIVDAR